MFTKILKNNQVGRSSEVISATQMCLLVRYGRM